MSDLFNTTQQLNVLQGAIGDESKRIALETCHKAHTDLIAVQTNIHPSVTQEIKAKIQALDPSTHASIEAVLAAHKLFPYTRNIDSLQAIVALTNIAKPTNLPPAAQIAAEQYSVGISHPLSRQSGASAQPYAAQLTWSRPDSSQQYGTVALPVRISVHPRPSHPLEIPLEIAADPMANIPRQWREQVVPRVLRLDRLIPTQDGGGRQDIELTIPLTRGEADKLRGRNLKVRFKLAGPSLLESVDQELTWRNLATDLPAMESPFPQNVDPDEMLQRPLGIERKFSDILSLVKSGEKSFLIHAPRRFGKTTLLRALVQKTTSTKDIIVTEDI
ncbi:MAG: hypothetical protein EOP84_29265, partial [Verrucomicrobiaceae bacterium]